MKKLTFLASMILACVAYSAADSVTITNGYGVLGFNSSFSPTYQFTFSGSGQSIPVPGPQDDWSGQRSLINDCSPCDPRTTTIDLLTNGGDIILHDNVFASGFIDFKAASFVSSLAPNGILVVNYRATADLILFRCAGPPGGLCDHQVGPTFVSNPNQLWYVRATFTPDPLGQYDFQNAVFSTSPVPEPSSLLLLGTGLLGILGAARRKLFH